jgi:hypothetical protein
MTYRQLTRDEIILLGQELDDLRHWEGARDYVSALYGLERSPDGHPHHPGHHPHQITISCVSEFQGDNFREVVSIIVTDARKSILSFDFSRYWWSQFNLKQETIAEFLRDTSGRLEHAEILGDERIVPALQDLCSQKLGINFADQARRHDPVTYTYFIDTLPAVSFPAVYVPD